MNLKVNLTGGLSYPSEGVKRRLESIYGRFKGYLVEAYHPIFGCTPGTILHPWATVELDDKQNKPKRRLKYKWRVYACKDCGMPCLNIRDVERAANGKK